MKRVFGPWAATARRLFAPLALGVCTFLAPQVSAQDRFAPPEFGENDVPIALLVDASTGQVLYSLEPHRRFVPASITKVMTLYTAFDLIGEGKLDPRRPIVVPQEVWEEWQGKGSRMFLNAGDRVPASDLMTGIANISANDASAVIAYEAAGSVPQWTQLMNAKARAIGMTQSHFGTPNGWPDDGKTFTTARDLVKLGRALLTDHPQKYSRYVGKPEFTYNGITQINHDPLLGRVAGADGMKTGYTNEAGFGYLGTVKRGDQRLIVVVAGAPRKRLRGLAAQALIEWGFSAFDRVPMFASGEVIGSARVQNGTARNVALMADGPITLNLPKGASTQLSMQIVYDGPLRAPVEAGERVASLEVKAKGLPTTRIPLRAQSSVEKAGLLARIVNGFAGWFS